MCIHKPLCDALLCLDEQDIQINKLIYPYGTAIPSHRTETMHRKITSKFFSGDPCCWVSSIQVFPLVFDMSLFPYSVCIDDFAICCILNIKLQLMSVELLLADKGGILNRSAVQREMIF